MNDEPRTLYEIVAVAQARMDAIEQRKREKRREAEQRANVSPAKQPEANRPHAVTVPELEAVIKIVAKEVAADRARLDALEALPPPMRYEGIWNETKAYDRGCFVTFQGGLWHAEDTNIGARPGAGSSTWKLAVKRGKAAER